MTIYSQSEELVSRCIECDLAEPESLTSQGGSAPGLSDGILSMRDHPWMTEGLMQDNCQFGDMLKDEKRKSKFIYELGRLMGEYAGPLPLGNFSLYNKETRRLALWKNRRGMQFDHVEHMEEGPELNKGWENVLWTVDEDMFTYVMKT